MIGEGFIKMIEEAVYNNSSARLISDYVTNTYADLGIIYYDRYQNIKSKTISNNLNIAISEGNLNPQMQDFGLGKYLDDCETLSEINAKLHDLQKSYLNHRIRLVLDL